jgi:hypothetical protein
MDQWVNEVLELGKGGSDHSRTSQGKGISPALAWKLQFCRREAMDFWFVTVTNDLRNVMPYIVKE